MVRIFMAPLPGGGKLTVVCYCGAGLAAPAEHTDVACYGYATPPPRDTILDRIRRRMATS